MMCAGLLAGKVPQVMEEEAEEKDDDPQKIALARIKFKAHYEAKLQELVKVKADCEQLLDDAIQLIESSRDGQDASRDSLDGYSK